MGFLYSAFGLGLQSDLPIPGLEPSSGLPAIDVTIWQAARPDWMSELAVPSEAPWRVGLMRDQNGAPLLRIWQLSRGGSRFIRMVYQSGNEFIIDAAAENVWVVTREARSAEYNALYLLGPVMTFVLRLRGVVCLHASAVVIDQRAIIFVGPPGAGKSTTAAAFARCGFGVLADDTVVLTRRENVVEVSPSYPRLRLEKQSVAALYESPAALPQLAPGFPKHYLDLTHAGRFQSNPTVLGAIYELGARVRTPDDSPIQSMSSRQALMTLIPHTFGSYILAPEQRAAEFQFLGDLVARVPVLRVTAADDLSRLDSLVETVVADFRSRSQTPSA